MGFFSAQLISAIKLGSIYALVAIGYSIVYSIMGMIKSEMTRKFDEIVDFAGIERYLDTPVKRFSSGMTVAPASPSSLS